MDDQPNERDLATIRRLMEESQHGVPGAGKQFIIWGLVVTAAVLLTYAALRGAPISIALVWAVSLATGWGLSLLVGWREAVRAPVQTLLARVAASIWIGCGITATLMSALGLATGAIPPQALPGAISLVIATGYFASSFAYRSAALRLLAAAWWLAGAGMLLWPSPAALLVMAGLLVTLQVLPGVLLSRRAQLRRTMPEA